MTWKPVPPGYSRDFNPHTVYEFGRDEWDETKFFRLSEASPYMNVAGLYYREAVKDQ